MINTTLNRVVQPLLTIREPLQRWAVIAALAVLSIAAGAATGLGRMNIALALGAPTVVLIGWVLFTRKFELMVLAIPLLAMVAPVDIPTGTYSKIPVVLLLVLALTVLWFLTMLVRGGWRITPTLLNRPMLAFCAACLVSYVWSILWRDPLINMGNFGNFTTVQVASLLTFYASLAAALLIGNFAQRERRLKIIFGMFIGIGSLMTLTQLLHVNTQGFLTDRGLWGLWMALPAFCLVIAQPRVRWYWRLGLLALVGMNLYQTVVVNLQWKSGWVPTIVGMFIAIFLRSKRWFAVLVAVSLIFVVVEQRALQEMTQAEEDEGATQRIGMWEINLRVIGDHWLFGTGPAGYAVYYMTYYPNDARSTHNNYLDIIAQFGVVGSVAWLWLAAAGVIEGLRQLKESPPGFLQVVALTATSGWAAAQFSMFFGDWVLPFAYNQTITGYKYTVYSWIFLGMLISVRAILLARRVAAQEPHAT